MKYFFHSTHFSYEKNYYSVNKNRYHVHCQKLVLFLEKLVNGIVHLTRHVKSVLLHLTISQTFLKAFGKLLKSHSFIDSTETFHYTSLTWLQTTNFTTFANANHHKFQYRMNDDMIIDSVKDCVNDQTYKKSKLHHWILFH